MKVHQIAKLVLCTKISTIQEVRYSPSKYLVVVATEKLLFMRGGGHTALRMELQVGGLTVLQGEVAGRQLGEGVWGQDAQLLAWVRLPSVLPGQLGPAREKAAIR